MKVREDLHQASGGVQARQGIGVSGVGNNGLMLVPKISLILHPSFA